MNNEMQFNIACKLSTYMQTNLVGEIMVRFITKRKMIGIGEIWGGGQPIFADLAIPTPKNPKKNKFGIGKNWQKYGKIDKNWQKNLIVTLKIQNSKFGIGKNKQKLAKYGKTWQK